MPNNNAPFGDIYAVQNSAIDRAANVLYQRKQQEDARGYQDYVNTQALLQKEIGNVRSADVEDYINKYQQYKNLRQQMIFDNKIKNNPKLYAQKNREATEAFNDALMFASASKQLKEQDAKLSQDIFTRPHNYNDDAHVVLQKNLNVPLSKRQDNYDSYAYTGADKDIQPLLQKAVGTPTAIFVDEADSKGGLQSQQRKFMVANSPQQMYEIIYGSLTDRSYAKALSQLASQTTPEDLAAIDNQYDQVMKSLPKSLSNKIGVEIKINPNNPLSVESAYLAKKLAIDKFSKIGEGELIKKTNSKETIDYRHEQAMKSIAANKGSGYGSNGSNQWVSEVVGAFQGGDKQAVKNAIGKMFSGNGTYELEPDAYGILDNGQLAITARPRGLTEKGRKKPAEQIIIDKNDSDIAHKLEGWFQRLTGSDTKGERTIISNSNVPQPKKATAKSYDVGGKSYSHNDLLTMGYTEDQIQQAIKLGTIK